MKSKELDHTRNIMMWEENTRDRHDGDVFCPVNGGFVKETLPLGEVKLKYHLVRGEVECIRKVNVFNSI